MTRKIPVILQLPNRPETARMVGEAAEHGTDCITIAAHLGYPADQVVGGKVMRKRGRSRWLIVVLAFVEATK